MIKSVLVGNVWSKKSCSHHQSIGNAPVLFFKSLLYCITSIFSDFKVVAVYYNIAKISWYQNSSLVMISHHYKHFWIGSNWLQPPDESKKL